MTTLSKSQFYKTKKLDGLSALDADIYHQSFPKHYHDTYQITLTKRGVFKNQINEKMIHAVKHNISITHPDQVHATLCDEKTGHSFFTLYLPPSLFKSQKSDTRSIRTQFELVIEDPILAQLLQKVQHHIANESNAIESTTWHIIDRLIQHHQSTPKTSSTRLSPFDLAQFSTNTSKFDLEYWAQQFGLNKFKFLRLFKNQTGMTPYQYLIFQRIKHSQYLLAEGCNLTDTALDCGFYDLSHFHKHFKNMTGVTPLTFQQAHSV